MTTVEDLRGLILSAAELRDMTDWPEALIEDYLTIIENLVSVAEGVDDVASGKLEDIPTDFTDGSIPFASSGTLSEDNARLVWSILTNYLTVANIKVNGNTELTDATASRLMSTNASKELTSVANLALWILQTSNQVSVSDNGDGTVTLSLPQDIDTEAEPAFADIVLPVKTVEEDYALLATDNIVQVNCWDSSTTVLLVHSNDYDGSVNFIDSSPSGKALTGTGAPYHQDDVRKFDASGIYFDIGDLIETDSTSDDFNFEDGMFTIHGWLKGSSLNASSAERVMKFGSNTGEAYYEWKIIRSGGPSPTSGSLSFLYKDSITAAVSTLTGTLPMPHSGDFTVPGIPVDTTMDHFAFVKGADEILRLYINGVADNTLDMTGKAIRSSLAYKLRIGKDAGSASYQGYMDEIHILKGVALWDGEFTPPIAASYLPPEDKTITVPSGIPGRGYVIIKSDQNTGEAIITPTGIQKIDNEDTLALSTFRERGNIRFMEDMWKRLNLSNNILVDGITGTANQVITTDLGLGRIQLSTPQDIDTDADFEVNTLVIDEGKIDTSSTAPTDLEITCGANKTIELINVVYEDLQVGLNNLAKGVTAPTDRFYDHGTGGVAFPVLGFAKNDYIWFDVQTSHSMKLNTILDCHIHFVLPNTTTIGHKFVFQLDVIVAGIDGTWAVPAGSPFTATHTVAANDNTKHRLLELGDIPASNTTVSSVYKCKLTRIDGIATEYASEVYLEFVDCHYQKNTMGSRQEGAK